MIAVFVSCPLSAVPTPCPFVGSQLTEACHGWRTTQGFLQPWSIQPGPFQHSSSSSTRKKGDVNHRKGPNILYNSSHLGHCTDQITLQLFMGSSCQELLTDTCLSLHTRKSQLPTGNADRHLPQFPTGNAVFGVDSTPVLPQPTPCPRCRSITAGEASAALSPAHGAPSPLRKVHLCVHLLCSTDNELSPN